MPAFSPTKDQFRALRDDPHQRPIVMVNLLKFRERADYPPDAPEVGLNLTGAQAYQRYLDGLNVFVERCGGATLFDGPAVRFYIGQGDWDRVLIVRYPSSAAFIAMVTDPDYAAAHRHREAGLLHQDLIQSRG